MKIYYVHDPMCSWCWAFRSVLKELIFKLPANIEFTRLLGGLAPDDDTPMSDETRDYVIKNWQRIQHHVPDTQFNYDFWEQCQPKRSTYPACRAVIAARLQAERYDEIMTYAIQKAYYLEARNPSESTTLIALADEIGLNVNQFCADLSSDKANEILHHEMTMADQLQLTSFPSLLIDNGQEKTRIEPDYLSAEKLLTTILQHTR